MGDRRCGQLSQVVSFPNTCRKALHLLNQPVGVALDTSTAHAQKGRRGSCILLLLRQRQLERVQNGRRSQRNGHYKRTILICRRCIGSHHGNNDRTSVPSSCFQSMANLHRISVFVECADGHVATTAVSRAGNGVYKEIRANGCIIDGRKEEGTQPVGTTRCC